MLKNITDYSKAIYFQENLKSIHNEDEFPNIEDQALNFYQNCMKERLKELKDIKKEYESLKKFVLSEDIISIEFGNRLFIFSPKGKDFLIEYLINNNYSNENIQDNLFNSLSIFLTKKNKIFIPNQVDLRKDNIYLGNYAVFISI